MTTTDVEVLLPTYRRRDLNEDCNTSWKYISNCHWLKNTVGSNLDMYPITESEQLKCAIDICAACPGQIQCLELAITNKEEHGIWGGTTESQRLILFRELDTDGRFWKDEWTREDLDRINDISHGIVNRLCEIYDIDDSNIEEVIDYRMDYFDSLPVEMLYQHL